MASNYMVKVYADLIRKGKKTIEEVPDPLQAAIREILENSKNGAEGLPSHDAKGVLQLSYGGERGFLFALRPLSFAECTEMISKDQQSVNLTARVFVRPCRPCCIAATFASYHRRDISGRESVEIFLRHFRQIAAA